ncbi:MAG: ABC transporter permease [Chloroflexota bacterium]
MLSYLARRLLLAVFTMWAISVLAFVIIQLPPVDFIDTYISELSAAGGGGMTQEQVQALRTLYGADQPKPIQYLRWMGLVLHGDFGFTLEYQRPVTEVIGDRLALTMVVSLAALVLTWAVSLPIGVYSAMRQYSLPDYVFTFLGFLGLAVPGFLLGLLVLYIGFAVFNVNLSGLFSAEYSDAPWSTARVWDLVKHLPVPAIVLGIAGMAQAIRIMRANLLDEIRKPYVVTARAKGLSETAAILKYPVRVALNPFASTIGYTLPYIVSGSIIVSLVLGLPTVGPLLLKALIATDLFLAGAIVLLLGVMTVIGTLVSDLMLMWIDPRIRLQQR